MPRTLSRFRLLPMRARDTAEAHRAASPLELFFDLVFVIAVATAAGELHHALAAAHVADGLVSYAIVFFGIWWAWMNFTWFATSFDTDDWLYRVLTFVQMGGVLVLAAGIGPAFNEHSFSLLVAGYVVMRVAMIAQWLRAAAGDQTLARTALVYATGIGVAQVLWVAWLFVPAPVSGWLLPVLIVAELAVPVVAERTGGTTPWHPHHITERYSLFTIILLGESLLGSFNAIVGAVQDGADAAALIVLAVLALTVTAALWWVYFWPPHHEAIGGLWQSLRYGYSHFVIFAAAGAVSVGIELHVDLLAHHSELDAVSSAAALAIPIALVVLGIWFVAIRQVADALVNTAVIVAVVLVIAAALLPISMLWVAIVLAALVVVLVVRNPLSAKERSAAGS